MDMGILSGLFVDGGRGGLRLDRVRRRRHQLADGLARQKADQRLESFGYAILRGNGIRVRRDIKVLPRAMRFVRGHAGRDTRSAAGRLMEKKSLGGFF
jgi:hypothetical protein